MVNNASMKDALISVPVSVALSMFLVSMGSVWVDVPMITSVNHLKFVTMVPALINVL